MSTAGRQQRQPDAVFTRENARGIAQGPAQHPTVSTDYRVQSTHAQQLILASMEVRYLLYFYTPNRAVIIFY